MLNPKFFSKYVKDLSRKAIRSVEKKFVVEGEKLIIEMLQSKVEFDEIFAIESWIEEHPTIPATLVSTKDLERISQLKSPK